MTREHAHTVLMEDGSHTMHEGWTDAPDTAGWAYDVPSAIRCRVCADNGNASLLEVTGATVVGGRYSLIWNTECPECLSRVDFPAYDQGEPS